MNSNSSKVTILIEINSVLFLERTFKICCCRNTCDPWSLSFADILYSPMRLFSLFSSLLRLTFYFPKTEVNGLCLMATSNIAKNRLCKKTKTKNSRTSAIATFAKKSEILFFCTKCQFFIDPQKYILSKIVLLNVTIFV